MPIPHWLDDVTVIVAIVALLGTIITQAVGAHNAAMDRRDKRAEKAEDNRLAQLTLTTDTMQEELNRLTSRVKDLEDKVARTEEALEAMRRLYRTATAYARQLLATIDDIRKLVPIGVSLPATPPAPDVIAQDL
ncbi:hypothetical protein [Actinomyces culturomici]|uniref:hypothetical protein n=1 Tax=Actinomyces culturomici TaxID=1926276 RepID=UPI001359CA08|nr:hypothetical protein [Actinomyces culturomici]